MYNPYNWKIDKKVDEKRKKCDEDFLCPFVKLVVVGSELDNTRLKQKDLKKELHEVNEELLRLENKKLSLINEIAKHP